MKNRRRSEHGFLADGQRRIVRENHERISREVRARYEDQLSGAGWLRRMILHIKIRRETIRELRRIAPTGGLYLRP